MIPILLFLLQASADAVPPVPEKFSILADQSVCGTRDAHGDIIVCSSSVQGTQRLPLPGDTGPPAGPAPSNPYLRPDVALNNSRDCSASRDCIVGFGPPVVPMIKGAVDLAKQAFAKKPDKTGRVAIDLNDPPPVDAQARVLP
jgi:hypothetical protein